ncbi:MAG: radical SAM protein, partial [Rhizobacter sp.]
MPAAPLRVLSLIPPMTQLNTPYPSTAYLTGFLRSRQIDAVQEDLALALMLKLFSREGLAALHERTQALGESQRTPSIQHFEAEYPRY